MLILRSSQWLRKTYLADETMWCSSDVSLKDRDSDFVTSFQENNLALMQLHLSVPAASW